MRARLTTGERQRSTRSIRRGASGEPAPKQVGTCSGQHCPGAMKLSFTIDSCNLCGRRLVTPSTPVDVLVQTLILATLHRAVRVTLEGNGFKTRWSESCPNFCAT